MVQAMAKRTAKTQIGLALIALGTVMILANVSVVANFFATLDSQTIGAPAPPRSPSCLPAQRRLRSHRASPLRRWDIDTIPRVRGSLLGLICYAIAPAPWRTRK